MHFTGLVALAAANVASAAMYGNASSSASPQPTNPSDTGLPGMVGPFKLLGCYTSSDGLSGFKMVASDKSMTLNLCAASCPSTYMAVLADECYCGQSLDTSSTTKVDSRQCNTPCPGQPSQFCGGKAKGASKRDVAAGDAVSLYQRTDSGPTSTKTVTSTSVGTVTSCPPEVHDCPVGQKTWRVMTSTIEVCPTPAPEWHQKKTVCYGGCCAPAHPGGKKYRVICQGDNCHTEECDSKNWYKLVQCTGDKCNYTKCQGEECNRKIVCFENKCIVEKCYGNECKSNLVCHGDECKHQQCNGGECHQTTQCDSNGQNCQNVPANNNPAPGPNNNAGNNAQGNNGQGNNGQGSNGQGNNGQGNNAQGNNGQGSNSNGQGNNGANAGGSPAGGAQATGGPVIAGAEGIAANLLGVAAGLFFVL